jgi:uncharacterized protein
MRLCVVSDSHRHRHELLRAVKGLQPLDAILHAGDETSDAEWLMDRVDWPIYAVAGNWDTVTPVFPLERVINCGVTLLLTHGHKQKVKEGLSSLEARAGEIGAEVVVFGHTHNASITVLGGRLFLNPGSLASPRGRRERTCALLEIVDTDSSLIEVRAAHITVHGDIVHVFHHSVDTRT